MKKRYRRLRIMEFPVSIAIALLAGAVASLAANAGRPEASLGGEIFVFPVVLIAAVWAFENIIAAVREELEAEERRRRMMAKRSRPKGM